MSLNEMALAMGEEGQPADTEHSPNAEGSG